LQQLSDDTYNVGMNERLLFTIGYAGYREKFDDFLEDLAKNKVSVLIDVRSKPYSAQFPEFNKEILEQTLKRKNITYRHYASEFGAKQTDEQFYTEFKEGEKRIDYDKFVKSPLFQRGVDKLKQIYQTGRIVAIMCAEKDPATCHRAIMIGNSLKNNFEFEVVHIIPGKPNKTQKDLEADIKKDLQEKIHNKKILNSLEEKLKKALASAKQPDLFEQSGSDIVDNMSIYYRIVNSHIGWKLTDVLEELE